MRIRAVFIALCALFVTNCDFNPWGHPGHDPDPQARIDSISVSPPTMRLGIDTVVVRVYASPYQQGDCFEFMYRWTGVPYLPINDSLVIHNIIEVHLPNDTTERFPSSHIVPINGKVNVYNNLTNGEGPAAVVSFQIELTRE